MHEQSEAFPKGNNPGARPQGKLTRVEIGHIVENPWQPRLRIKDEELRDLAESIARHGFIGHLEVRHDPDDPSRPFQLVFGHRRLRAAELAGMRTLSVEVVERNDEQMQSLAFLENHTQQQPSPWEEAIWMDQLMREFGYSIRGLARLLGTTKGYVENRLKVLQIPEESPLRQAAERDEVSLTALTAFVDLSKLLGEEERGVLERAAAAGEVRGVDLYHLKLARQHSASLPGRENGLDASPEPGEGPSFDDATSRPAAVDPQGLRGQLNEHHEPGVVPGSYRLNRLVLEPRSSVSLAKRLHAQLAEFMPGFRLKTESLDWDDLEPEERAEIRSWLGEIQAGLSGA